MPSDEQKDDEKIPPQKKPDDGDALSNKHKGNGRV